MHRTVERKSLGGTSAVHQPQRQNSQSERMPSKPGSGTAGGPGPPTVISPKTETPNKQLPPQVVLMLSRRAPLLMLNFRKMPTLKDPLQNEEPSGSRLSANQPSTRA